MDPFNDFKFVKTDDHLNTSGFKHQNNIYYQAVHTICSIVKQYFGRNIIICV